MEDGHGHQIPEDPAASLRPLLTCLSSVVTALGVHLQSLNKGAAPVPLFTGGRGKLPYGVHGGEVSKLPYGVHGGEVSKGPYGMHGSDLPLHRKRFRSRDDEVSLESLDISPEGSQAQNVKAIALPFLQLAAILQPSAVEELAHALTAVGPHCFAGFGVPQAPQPPGSRRSGVPGGKNMPTRHNCDSNTSLETASQLSGETQCGEQRRGGKREEDGQARTVIRRQTSRRRLDLEAEALAAEGNAQRDGPSPNRMDSLVHAAGFLEAERGVGEGGLTAHRTDSDHSSSGWTMRSSPGKTEALPNKGPTRAVSTGNLARVQSLSGWAGSGKRSATSSGNGKRVPARAVSLGTGFLQHMTGGDPTGVPAVPTPSPDRCGGARSSRPAVLTPAASPEIRTGSQSVRCGTETPPLPASSREVGHSGGGTAGTGVTGGTERSSGGTRIGLVTGRQSKRLGSWTPDEKRRLVDIVKNMKQLGPINWEGVANELGRWTPHGASAERMYRSLTDPAYQHSTNKHGRRINSRKCTPMHVMAVYALRHLPNHRGNLNEIAEIIGRTEEFEMHLDWSPRPGTKTYPRWKDALVGCFKEGRYPHLSKAPKKVNGLNVYVFDERRINEKTGCNRRRTTSTVSGETLLQKPSPSPPMTPDLATPGGFSMPEGDVTPLSASPMRVDTPHSSMMSSRYARCDGSMMPSHLVSRGASGTAAGATQRVPDGAGTPLLEAEQRYGRDFMDIDGPV